jgi:hypothetical protein
MDSSCERGDEILESIKKTPSPLVDKRTVPTERPPLVDEI